MRNWVVCNQFLADDMKHLRKCFVVRYDDFAANPVAGTRQLEDSLDIDPGMDAPIFRNGFNNRYFPIWASRTCRHGTGQVRNLVKRVWTEAETRYIEERDINAFGYSFCELRSA